MEERRKGYIQMEQNIEKLDGRISELSEDLHELSKAQATMAVQVASYHEQVMELVKGHHEILYGNGTPGVKIEVDRLVQAEKKRQRHIIGIWTAVAVAAVPAVWGGIKELIRSGIVKTIFFFAVLLLMGGCSTFRFPDGPQNTPPPQYQKIERRLVEPATASVVIEGKSYPVAVGYREDYRYDINATPPAPPRRTLLGWLFSLSAWWLWAFVAFLIFVPGAFAYTRYRVGAIRRQLAQVVQGVGNYLKSKTPSEVKDLKESLSAAMDNETKLTVDQIKRVG